ncbi:MAG: DUF4097 family beta strand repeat protein [Gemmatimonadaceae bacterium]|nr:DUF4097 family beta strand repeat protein [Gemmatimonadaceae bacterium]
MKKSIFAAVALALLAPLAVLEAQQGLGRDQEVWTWSGTLAAGQWARGHSINGSVKFEASPDNQIHIRGEKNWGRRGDPQDISFALVRTSTGLIICVLRHELDTCTEEGISSRRHTNYNNDARADLTIQVPRGAHVSANTINGSVRVDGMSGEIKAHTVNGGVIVTTSGGPVSASTVNGSVRAEIGTASREAMRFNTVNGSVEVSLPSETRANLDISTVNGSINTEFPVTITGRWGPKSARGTINGGGETISISTVNGSVKLRRS